MTARPRTSSARRKAKAQRELARRQRAKWAGDVLAFFREALGIEPTDEQAAAAVDFARTRRVSWRSGHRLGKSTLIAGLALWVVHCIDGAIAVVTSGNATQVKVVNWRELRRLHRGAKVALGGKCHLDPASGLVFDDGRGVFGITAKEPERLTGYAAPGGVFLFVDEASGFDDELIEAALGNLAGGGGVFLAGNPTRPTGFFARTHRERLAGWSLHHVSSMQSPNVRAGRVVVRGLATVEWVEQMRSDFGADSAAFAVRVLGEFPSEGSDVVVPLALLETALSAWDDEGHGLLEVGVDPARFGDDESVIQGRRGIRALAAVEHRKLDNVELAARVLDYVRAHRRGREPVVIRVDVGGLGAGVYDHLIRADEVGRDGIGVEQVNAASTSRYPARFKNTRSELWWCIRRWLERGGQLPPDQRRDAELLCARFGHDAQLRVVVESKDDMRKKLRRSPDRADALALAVYGESPVEETASEPSVDDRPIEPSESERIGTIFGTGEANARTVGSWL